jgi:uncharacterized protein (DUF2141 family)
MKNPLLTILTIFLVSGVILGISSFTSEKYRIAEVSTLIVKVTGVTSKEGKVHVLLFNQATGYPTNEAKAYKHVKAQANANELTITIDKIAYGTYSIVAFHDKNSNEEFDKSWFGSPKENYGFSNIPGEYCGTPSFQQTSFSVNQKTSIVTINLMNVE